MDSQKNMEDEHVWEFTNQKKLTKKEFIDYVERKVFRTIRKYMMLPHDKKILLKESSDINTEVLKYILEKKFEVNFSNTPNFSSMNLSAAAEKTFENVLAGKLTGPRPEEQPRSPLYFVSDKEIELYAKLTERKGEKRKRNERIQSLFEKFLKKNPDLEQNIVNALFQIKQS